MKNLSKILLALFVVVFAISCSEDGATGPAGPAGPTGPAGPAGPTGPAGSANVTVYDYTTDFSWTGSKNITLTGISATELGNALTLVYFKDQTCVANWYAAPGLGCLGVYQTRYYKQNTSIIMNILDPDGTAWSGTAVTIVDVKIFVIPPGTTINLRTSKPLSQLSYKEACRLFGVE